MKLAYKDFENVVQFQLQKRKPKTTEYTFQLILNLVGLYVANKITVDIWRSLTGH